MEICFNFFLDLFAIRHYLICCMMTLYQRLKQQHLCVVCRQPTSSKGDGNFYVHCDSCRIKFQPKQYDWNHNRARFWHREQRANAELNGYCTRCYGRPASLGRKLCSYCLGTYKIYNRHRAKRGDYKRWRKKFRFDMLLRYGRQCACCGESNLHFLTIDHPNNDGAQHRKLTGNGYKFYLWLKRNNFPREFQLLCFNCNMARHHNGGICPHKITMPIEPSMSQPRREP